MKKIKIKITGCSETHHQHKGIAPLKLASYKFGFPASFCRFSFYKLKMIDEAASFTTLLKGKRVKLTLKNSTFVGLVQRVNTDRTLVLADG